MTAADLCARCSQTLPVDCVSLYFCDYWCQRQWHMARLSSDDDRRIAAGTPAGMAWSAG